MGKCEESLGIRLFVGGESLGTRLVVGRESMGTRLVVGRESLGTRLVVGGESMGTRLVVGGESMGTRLVVGGKSLETRLIVCGRRVWEFGYSSVTPQGSQNAILSKSCVEISILLRQKLSLYKATCCAYFGHFMKAHAHNKSNQRHKRIHMSD